MGIKFKLSGIVCFFVIQFLLGCVSSVDTNRAALFTALSSRETGIYFLNTNTEDDVRNILQYEYFYNGGGVALGDINNDGWVDIYFSSNQGENKLYLNKGNLLFEDITEKSGVTATGGWKTGVAMVDINADGYLDIYVSLSGSGPPISRENLLFINNGNLTFTNKAKVYGLDDDSYSTQAIFLDYDRDGDLDVFLLNHSRLTISNSFDITRRSQNKRVKYVGNRLYRNDRGQFREVSDSLGVYGSASNYGLGVVYSDLNNDGWMDIYASNDYTGNDKLLLNEHGGFKEVSDSLLTHMSQFSMGVDIADVNNDGLMDIFSLDMLPESNHRQKELLWPNKYDVYFAMVKNGLHHQYMRNMLHLNNGDGSFSEIGQLAGVSNTDWSWSALFADFDNDGWQDLFVSNGFKREFINNDFLKYKADLLIKVKQGKKFEKMEDIINKMPSNKVHNYLFQNRDGLSFTDVSTAWGFSRETLTNGAAYADLDNDGDLDLIMNNLDDNATIYRNNTRLSGRNSFLKLRLKGSDQNTYGLGATATLFCGDKMMKRTLCPYKGFQSSMEPSLFFGVDTTRMIDSLILEWPRGEIQLLKNIQANQSITLHQQDAVFPSQRKKNVKSQVLFVQVKDAIPFQHKENDFVDFRVQPLLFRSYSTSGPAMVGGDVNQDGRLDLYLGGAKNQPAAIFIQQAKGGYSEQIQKDFIKDARSEDTDAVFFDIDNDGDLDLYVVSGGYEFSNASPLLQDRLYENDGLGNFKKMPLPVFYSSGSCARPADIDNDGDMDLFVGGRIVPGRYPEMPESYLLINDGIGVFSIETNTISKELERIGMVTDAAWLDLNQDNWPDLVVVGEWMPITIFINEHGKLKDRTTSFIKEITNGWWNRVLAQDFDSDGDADLVVGNFGMNNQFHASLARPISMYYSDYDGNGSVDPIMNYFIGTRSYPSPTRDELMDQLPTFRKRFPDNASYTKATIETMLTPAELKQSSILTAYRLETTYLQNEGKSFILQTLPFSAQVSPILALHAMDVNQDGILDIVAGGNLWKMNARFGNATGNFGTILLGDGNGYFETVSPVKSGLCIRGEVKNIIQDGNKLIFSINNSTPLVYSVNYEAK
jgi:enediyne biosynthesis protein E4